MKCHYHPRSKAVATCSRCGVGLCRKCIIEDNGIIYCDVCYADGIDPEEELRLAEQEGLESEDYIDLELMDILDSEDDEGLF